MIEWVLLSVSLPLGMLTGEWMRRRAAQRVASTSEGLLYMNYDDAAAPSAVISLWICWVLLAHWWKAHPPWVRGNASGGLFIPLLTFRYARCECRCTNCNILPGREISRTNERSHRAFGMQILQTVVCKRTYATHAV